MKAPTVSVTCRRVFAAAHQLSAPGLDAEANRQLYGPCADLHGHTYEVEVTIEGPVDPATGMVTDFAELFRCVDAALVEPCDHKFLNSDVPFLAGSITTAENIAVAFWRELDSALTHLPECRLQRIRLCESPTTSVVYEGPAQND